MRENRRQGTALRGSGRTDGHLLLVLTFTPQVQQTFCFLDFLWPHFHLVHVLTVSLRLSSSFLRPSPSPASWPPHQSIHILDKISWSAECPEATSGVHLWHMSYVWPCIVSLMPCKRVALARCGPWSSLWAKLYWGSWMSQWVPVGFCWWRTGEGFVAQSTSKKSKADLFPWFLGITERATEGLPRPSGLTLMVLCNDIAIKNQG